MDRLHAVAHLGEGAADVAALQGVSTQDISQVARVATLGDADQLLPKYKDQVNNHWPEFEATLRKPYDQQLESHRPMWNIAPMLQSALETTKVSYQ